MNEIRFDLMTTEAIRELARELVSRLSDDEARRLLDEIVRDREKAS